MKRSTLICFLLFLAGVCLGLIQLWFQLWSPDTFYKLMVTDAAFFLISLVLAFLIRETRESRKLNNDSSLD